MRCGVRRYFDDVGVAPAASSSHTNVVTVLVFALTPVMSVQIAKMARLIEATGWVFIMSVEVLSEAGGGGGPQTFQGATFGTATCGGGAGATTYQGTGTNGTANTGGGGGASHNGGNSTGGSGVVIVSYPTPPMTVPLLYMSNGVFRFSKGTLFFQ
jgi:hypothetical protein